MLDPRIIEEAYDEIQYSYKRLDESGLVIESESNDKKPEVDKIKKLVNNISSLLHKFDDIEDKDSISDIISAVNKSIVKMVDQLTSIVNDVKEEKNDEGDDKKTDSDSKDTKDSSDNKDRPDDDDSDKDNDEKDSKKDEDDDKVKDKYDDKYDDKKDDKKEEESQMLKLFPTESVTSPQGIEYTILEVNEDKSLLKDIANGEKFKIDNKILKKWKSS